MSRRAIRTVTVSALLAATWAAAPVAAAQLRVILPLGRVAYQDNERIDLSIVRANPAALKGGELVLDLNGGDGSRMHFAFAMQGTEAEHGEARKTEHLHLNGRLLRPGRYTINVASDGAVATTNIEVYSHVRHSDFKTIDWASTAKDKEQATLGEDSLGFNLIFASYGGLNKDEIVRSGADFMWCCTMSGGHQMDLRQECDWSDPYVLQGGEARVVRRALQDRTMPNCIGVHYYDEPGLTWWKDTKTGVMSPFNVPSQDRSFKSAFGHDAPQYENVKPDDAKAVAEWDAMNRWREQFMPAAWKYSAFGVSRVRPDFLSVTQSVYGYSAYADGYYFNVVAPLPGISGHGGYSDWGPSYFNPVHTLEMGRIRDLNKPTWYLPEWSGNLPPAQYRLAQNLCFMTNLQGLDKQPDVHVQTPESSVSSTAVVECNKMLSRLGTIFTKMPVTRPPVAMLYSLSQNLHAEVRDMQNAQTLDKAAYLGGGHNRDKTFLAWMAAEEIHQRLFPIVEEDVLDGELAAHHKAVVLPGIDYLDPKVVKALEAYIKGGGTVLVSDDSKVQIAGATKLGAPMDTSYMDKLAQLWAEKKNDEIKQLDNAAGYMNAAAPVAVALRRHLEELGLKPALDADSPGILTSRQAQGDIEYLFATNATYDEKAGERNSVRTATASLSTADDARPVYDAVRTGKLDDFKPAAGRLQAKVRFGPGELRVFARTARPIGGVQVATPSLFRDYTVENAPSRVEFAASLVDSQHNVLSGAAPMQIVVTDPLGMKRYDLYRATDHGQLRLSLPLAANDPSGDWKITVRELLSGTEGSTTFPYAAPPQCGALAGATHRAVMFGNDRDNIFRLFRTHHEVTVVRGTSDYNKAAAERIMEILKPWDVQCKIVDAAEVNKPRPISPEAAPTWAGLDPGRAEPGTKNAPNLAGFDLRGPAILLGTPEDNPLIKFAAEKDFLPYKSDAKDFPGRARGYIAWQRDAVGYGQESVTLIAYDADGMSEAVGTMYEAAAGMDPLMPLEPPSDAAVTAATKSTLAAPEAPVAWRAVLPDSVASIEIAGDQIKAATLDGFVSIVSPDGKVTGSQEAAFAAPPPKAVKPPETLVRLLIPNRVVKHVTNSGGLTAVGFWGGGLQVFDQVNTLKTQQQLPQDVTALAWHGNELLVGQSDGTLLALRLN